MRIGEMFEAPVAYKAKSRIYRKMRGPLYGEPERTPGFIQNRVSFSVIAAMVMVIVTSMIRVMIRVAMVRGCYRWGSAGRDRGRPDNIDTAAASIFGFGLSRGGNRCPNRDEGCGGNDERLLHAASPESNLALKCEERYPYHKHNGARRNYPRSWAKVPCPIG
jgi:hypothetical protein